MTETHAPPLRAFHGNPAVKADYLARVAAHRAADQLLQGYGYWQNGKGCAVGCTLHVNDPDEVHDAYETELGVPAVIAHLEDAIFEALPKERAMLWPEQLLQAIPVGADLSQVWPQFAAWMMDDPTYGIAHKTEDENIKGLCLEVARRYRAGETTGPDADELASRLARDAWDAWAARAAWAARDAWDAWAARAAWAARDARAAFVSASADTLLSLLAAAPVPALVTADA